MDLVGRGGVRGKKGVQVLHSSPEPHLVIISQFEHSNQFSSILNIYCANLSSLYCIIAVKLKILCVKGGAARSGLQAITNLMPGDVERL